MKLNKRLELALKTVDALKNHQDAIHASALAVEVGTTKSFQEQILRDLRNGGIVISKRGPGGGYMLSRTEPFTALDVASATGRQLVVLGEATAPTDRLSNAITEAFRNTVV